MERGRDERCCRGVSHRRHQEIHAGPVERSNRTAIRVQTGFSLLELLLVAAILVVLASLYFGPSANSRQSALQAACQKNLQKLFIAMQIYANDSGGNYPKVAGARTSAEALDVLVPRYTSDTSVFICPASDDSPIPNQSLKNNRISYAYYMGRGLTNSAEALVTDRQVNTLAKAAGQPIFSSTGKPPGNNHGKMGGHLLFSDGHLDSMPALASAPLGLNEGEILLNP
jgi:prepilin-type N-terminal cleavage/methylation domain-containing protein